jgi:hypothetical protein
MATAVTVRTRNRFMVISERVQPGVDVEILLAGAA